jgi:hypothetical protein
MATVIYNQHANINNVDRIMEEHYVFKRAESKFEFSDFPSEIKKAILYFFSLSVEVSVFTL